MAESIEDKSTNRLAEGDDLEEQMNECLALEAIYESEGIEICPHDNKKGDLPGGILDIPIFPTQPFFVKMTKEMAGIRRLAFAAARGRGRRSRLSPQNSQESPNATSKQNDSGGTTASATQTLYPIKRLPPITLTFAFPHDYPSTSPPNFTLSCCWLEKKNLSKLCEKFDEIWSECGQTPLVMNWVNFIQEESLSFLGINSPYDLGRVLVHLFTHPTKDPSQPEPFLPLKPRPFDPRIFQTFGSIDEVLPTVLDSNLQLCDICFEEKGGDKFVRLVNCLEHSQCKECMGGWFEERIREGAVRDLHCPGFNCDKMVLPTEVSQVVNVDLYQRYEKLLLKTALDVMTDVMNCPRTFCQFPVVIEDNLGVCQQCQHAFCGRCQNTYHGHNPCKLKSDMYTKLHEEYQTADEARKRELEMRYGRQTILRVIDEVKSNQWLQSNSKQCPCCSTFIQKKDGCNKMTCPSCRTFFCWLCLEELSRSNPYAHYMIFGTNCANRLFEGIEMPEVGGEEEDEDDHLLNLLEDGGFLIPDDDDDDDDDVEFVNGI